VLGEDEKLPETYADTVKILNFGEPRITEMIGESIYDKMEQNKDL
jgi:hypothetical protein